MKGLAGKTTLITGGASGFGAGMVERFAAAGANVLLQTIVAVEQREHNLVDVRPHE